MKKWIINCKVFENKEKNEQVLIVINDIINEFERLVPTGPSLGIGKIELVNDVLYGPTLYWPKDQDYYKVALNVSDVNYNQIAFQFSQELCRIYCNPRVNNWLIQLLSQISGLHTLDFLGNKWEKNPPCEELKEYWYNFDSYKNNLLGAAFSKVDMVKYQVANEWVKYQIGKFKTSKRVHRGKLLIIAYELLPMFKENPESWQILSCIGECSEMDVLADQNATINKQKTEPDFKRMMEKIPENMKSFVHKLFEKIGAEAFV